MDLRGSASKSLTGTLPGIRYTDLAGFDDSQLSLQLLDITGQFVFFTARLRTGIK